MPSPFVKKLSQELGRPISEIESLWKKAKSITANHFKISISDFGENEYTYTTGVLKKMVGLDERTLDVSHFLSSKKSAAEFIKEMTSGPIDAQIGPDSVIPPDDEDTPVPYTPESVEEGSSEKDEEKDISDAPPTEDLSVVVKDLDEMFDEI